MENHSGNGAPGLAGDSDGEGEQKPKGFRPFAKGIDPRRSRVPASSKTAESVPKLLKAMRHVSNADASRDRTQLQKDCRAWKAKDIKSFMTEWARLERALLARAHSPRAAQPSTPKWKPLCERCARIGAGHPVMSCKECNERWYGPERQWACECGCVSALHWCPGCKTPRPLVPD